MRTCHPCRSQPHDPHISPHAAITTAAAPAAAGTVEEVQQPRLPSDLHSTGNPSSSCGDDLSSHQSQSLPSSTVPSSDTAGASCPPSGYVQWSSTSSLLLPCGNGTTLEILEVRWDPCCDQDLSLVGLVDDGVPDCVRDCLSWSKG